MVRTIEGYYVLRGRAIASGDIEPLFAAHPSLGTGEDRAKGINSERFYVFELMRGPGHTQLKVELEANEPIRVWVKDGAAAAFVHGRESYPNPDGIDTIAEFYTRFDLVRIADHWTIDRSDEVRLHERPPRTPAH